jgi:hypothetical protein
MVGVGLNLKSQSFLSHPHRGVGLLGHGQLSFVSYIDVGTLGTIVFIRSVQEVLCAIQNPGLKEPPIGCNSMSNNFTFVTAGGRIRCIQCQAKSKRTKQQCRAPASKGKTKCRFHGGASTGPKTPEGRKRCVEARTKTGTETRKARTERAEAMRRLRALEELGHALGIMHGPKMPGRKPLPM